MISWQDRIACLFIVTALLVSSPVFSEEEGPVAELPGEANPVPTREVSEEAEEPGGEGETEEGTIHVHAKGYYKNLAIASRSITNDKPFSADIQRFRIEPTIEKDQIQIYAAYDNEIVLGDFLRSPDFSLFKEKDQKNLAWQDAEWILADQRDAYYETYLYRLYIRYYDPRFQIILGKQKVDWGICRFWSPMDLFNPNSPLDIEKDERVGVDALNIEASITNFMDIDILYAPQNTIKKSSFAIRTLCRVATYDIFFMCGQFKKDNVIGGSFDGYLGGAGIRGEFTYTWQHGGREFFRFVIGTEYAFPNTLRMGAEYFFNGGSAGSDRQEFLNSYQFSREALTLEENLIGAQVGYDLTPLIKWDNYLIYDIDKKSIFINPELKYNIRPNLDITLGTQLFWGTADSEFGDYTNVYYAEAKYFF